MAGEILGQVLEFTFLLLNGLYFVNTSSFVTPNQPEDLPRTVENVDNSTIYEDLWFGQYEDLDDVMFEW